MKLLCVLLVAVSANAATSLDVELPIGATTGVAFNFTVRALNGGSTDTAYTGTVHFTSDDPKAVLPPDYTFVPADAGTHTFSATMNSAGPGIQTASHTVTATDVANSSVHGIDITSVRWNDNVVRQFALSVPSAVDRTVPYQVEVRALNASSVLIPSYTGTIRFLASRQETVPADYTFTSADAGRHTFSITANLGTFSWFTVFQADDNEVFGGLSNRIDVRCPELTAMASNSGPACPHSQALLFGSANLPVDEYAWSLLTPSGHALFESNLQNPTVGAPGTFLLWVHQQSDDCSATAQTTVTVHTPDPPQVTLSANAMCGPGNLRATITNASEFSSLNWSAAGGTIASGQGTPSVEIAPDSNATLIRLSLGATGTSSGCDASRSVADVPVGGSMTTAISTPPNSCALVTQSASVADGGSGAVYAWTIAHGTITGGAGTRAIQYVADGTGDVTLKATVTNGGCHASDSAVVSITTKPEIMKQPQGTTIAFGRSATLAVTAAGGGLRYRWYEGQSGDRAKLVSISFDPFFTTPALASTTSYWAEVENDCGSEESRTAVVAVASGKRRAVGH